MIKKTIILIGSAVLLPIIFGCAESGDSSVAMDKPAAVNMPQAAPAGSAGFIESAKSADARDISKTGGKDDKSGESGKKAEAFERKLIQNGSMDIAVKDYKKTFEQIKLYVKKSGGFISNTSESKTPEGKLSGNVTLRIPASGFNDTFKFLESLGDMKNSSRWVDDVTEKFYDLKIRLKNAERLEQRLLVILETKTNKVIELLEVERELGRVRENIEQMKGRKRFLVNRISLSTLTVNIYEPSSTVANEMSPVYPLIQAIDESGTLFFGSLGALIMFIVAVVPWALLVLGGIFAGAYMLKRRRRKKAIQADVKKDTEKTPEK